jgi:hypothetical protein
MLTQPKQCRAESTLRNATFNCASPVAQADRLRVPFSRSGTQGQYTTARFIVPPNIRSHTDNDGAVILHIGRNKIYNLIGVGSMMWGCLTSSQTGLTRDDLVRDLAAEFPDVPARQIEQDVERLLIQFYNNAIIEMSSDPHRVAHRVELITGKLFLCAASRIASLLLQVRLLGLAAFLGLFSFNLILKVLGFGAFYDIISRWPLDNKSAAARTTTDVLDAVTRAITWYPKRAWCLQQSSVTACLLRSTGVSAEMVIGCQKLPFLIHAWVEVDGQVVNDRQRLQQTHIVLDRCRSVDKPQEATSNRYRMSNPDSYVS